MRQIQRFNVEDNEEHGHQIKLADRRKRAEPTESIPDSNGTFSTSRVRDRLKTNRLPASGNTANGNDKKDSECPVMSDDFSDVDILIAYSSKVAPDSLLFTQMDATSIHGEE